ncbi:MULTISPECIES: helix-turn-helix domain-containing protein [Enterococcus]|uniref:helix-turn-helix domain-containing protein n=1 Tax=Enterococcus TaxID=1350 RepID=UPI000EC02227|nr:MULTISPECIES: helix-turn-helix transcriptional regulator [Enterococcus]HCM86801.1 XRE family transcriptional regulator [Enterococcus sp.]
MKKPKELMISENLSFLRKQYHYTLEEVADKLSVTRQTAAQWETGEALPDVVTIVSLADFYDVTVNDLIRFDEKKAGSKIPPNGKHMFGIIKIQERGQVVIPKDARTIFKINKGDSFVLLGDESPESFGLALIPVELFLGFSDELLKKLRNGMGEKEQG